MMIPEDKPFCIVKKDNLEIIADASVFLSIVDLEETSITDIKFITKEEASEYLLNFLVEVTYMTIVSYE